MSNTPTLRFGEFDGEWSEKRLGDIAIFYNSKRIPLTESDRKKGKYPYYGASGIIDYVDDYLFDGKEMIKEATERSQEIQTAYDLIKKTRGMK